MLVQRGTMCFLKFQSYVQTGEVGNWPRNKFKQKKVLKKRLCLALLLLIFVALCIKYCFHRINRTTCISNICLSKTGRKKKSCIWIFQLLITLPNDAKFSQQSLIFKIWRSKICRSCSLGRIKYGVDVMVGLRHRFIGELLHASLILYFFFQ